MMLLERDMWTQETVLFVSIWKIPIVIFTKLRYFELRNKPSVHVNFLKVEPGSGFHNKEATRGSCLEVTVTASNVSYRLIKGKTSLLVSYISDTRQKTFVRLQALSWGRRLIQHVSESPQTSVPPGWKSHLVCIPGWGPLPQSSFVNTLGLYCPSRHLSNEAFPSGFHVTCKFRGIICWKSFLKSKFWETLPFSLPSDKC